MTILEPKYCFQALKSKAWKKAMEEEPFMIEKNQTWKQIDKLKNKKFIGVKWAFKIKFNADGSINKHKTRLMMKD